MDERDLLAAVIASPDDDAPRLVYADWLLEHGDGAARARGELIQCECVIARLPDESTPRRAALVRRAAQLRLSDRPWITNMLEGVFGPREAAWEASWRFDRGLVTAYTRRSWSGEEIARYLRSIQSRIPVNDLEVHCRSVEDLRAFLTAEGVERLRSLRAHLGTLPDDAIAILAQAQRLTELRSLRVAWFPGQNVGIDPLLSTDAFPHLECLGLELPVGPFCFPRPGEPLAADALASLEGSPLSRTLRSFELSRNHLGESGIRAICELPLDLESIAVHASDVGHLVARLAEEPIRFRSLRAARFNVGPGEIGLGTEDLVAFLDRRPRIEAIHVKSALSLAVDRLVAPPDRARLRTLALPRCQVGDSGVRAIVAATHLHALRELDLSSAEMSHMSVKALVGAPHLQSLRRLDLSINRQLQAEPFLEARGFADIEHLDLRESTIQLHSTFSTLFQSLYARYGAAVVI
jgi:uncharacterized protein (TIGR02996 family)